MRRRQFLGMAAGAVPAWPQAARAQQTVGMLRVGVVNVVPRTAPVFAVLPRRLAELGYIEGENITDYEQAVGAEKALEAAYR